MKILLTIEDISYGRGAERVTVNLANALCECGHEVSILSFYQRHPNLPYTDINPSVKLFFRYNYEQSIAQEESKKQFFKGFYYKNIHKLILSYELKNADYDFIISSGFAYFPYFKNKKTKYIKIIHTNFHRYSSRNALFDTLAVLSTKELDIWQKYHNFVRVIPNFLPKFPSQNTNCAQKRVLAVGSLSKEKGFLRLLDIWKIVQTYPHTGGGGLSCHTNTPCHNETFSCHTEGKAQSILNDENKDISHSLNMTKKENLNATNYSKEIFRYAQNDKVEVAQNDKNQDCHFEQSAKHEAKNLKEIHKDNEDSLDSSATLSPQNDKSLDLHNDDNLTQWQLIIVGDGVLKKELESKIKALNLQERVILKPFTKQIEKEYLSASIYAMSSHFEGFGMVLAEASSYGLPCIAFDIKAGPSDIIDNEKSGFLVEDNDLQGYADKLMLLMRDENLRQNFGTKAKRVVSEKFSQKTVLELWQKLFDEIKTLDNA